MLRSLPIFFVIALVLSAQDVKHINPPGLSPSPAYTHVVTAKPGTVIWISGQVALDSNGELVGKRDLKAQLDQAWNNMKIALAGSGATFADVVKITTFIVNYSPSMRSDVRDARARAMGKIEPPASTLVGVQSLATEGLLVEIEATAVIR